jgi:sterol desaturase/sphingolipid hydroxylase (fatty acid hydroxylase superfamily)
MRLNRFVYFADFVVYPFVVVILFAAALRQRSPPYWEGLAAGCACGVAIWSLLEYLIHRFGLHGIAYFAAMHDMHHSDPRALVGSPVWLSLGAFCCGALLPLWLLIGVRDACSVTAGLMLGYFWFGLLHHRIHHSHPSRGTYLWRLKRRHALHHYGRTPCNFGVITSVWDRMFGTFRSE